MSSTKIGEPLFNNFKIPSWASRPPTGLHLDVMKDGKLIQKLMIDEKKCYYFGRNRQLCDFPIDHQSCSRVHAALVWHKNLSRPFLIDLESAHGTFIGRIRLEAHRPQQVPLDSEIHFGASHRIYVIRERPGPSSGGPNLLGGGGSSLHVGGGTGGGEGGEGGLTSVGSAYWALPETERELDNLTEFNTAHNRRIASMADMTDPPVNPLKKRKRLSVQFGEVDDLINPEDVDPNVGRFRNLVHETFIPNKRSKLSISLPDPNDFSSVGGKSALSPTGVHLAPNIHPQHGHMGQDSFSIAAKLGLPVPNLAPDVEAEPPRTPPHIPSVSLYHGLSMPLHAGVTAETDVIGSDQPKKKKYAKEAWPGKRPGFLVAPT